jgi:glycolate oxidase FAD binding subunit
MTLKPETVAQLQDAVRADNVVIRGAGTKSPSAKTGQHTLELCRLTGVTEYSPDECVFTAMAGTPLRDIDAMLAAKGQYLPFDPPLARAGATIGGTVASGLSGSGRYRYGGVRDFVIGARIVDGEGRAIHSGGRVVKNAAGFLLHHGMVGSRGRFGVLTELTFKVFPAPEARATLRIERDSVEAALQTARTLQDRRFDLEAIDFNASGTMWIRVAGRTKALGARLTRLQAEVGGIHVSGADEDGIWQETRDFGWAGSLESLVQIPESRAARVLPTLLSRPHAPSTIVRYTLGGACAWVATDNVASLDIDLASAGLRGVAIRGPDAGKRVGAAETNAFDERVRRVLDPHHRFSAASDSR